jgi:hypothetical protein
MPLVAFDGAWFYRVPESPMFAQLVPTTEMVPADDSWFLLVPARIHDSVVGYAYAHTRRLIRFRHLFRSRTIPTCS